MVLLIIAVNDGFYIFFEFLELVDLLLSNILVLYRVEYKDSDPSKFKKDIIILQF